MFKYLSLYGSAIFVFFFASLACADAPPFYTKGEDKLMLEGYDVVSYYLSPVPRLGSSEYEYEYSGVKWRFVSQSNLNHFKKNPKMYLPEFGGYCVWAIAHGRLTGGLPQYWKIVDGKLYLFCSAESMRKWMTERELINRLAEDNWPEILEQ